MAKQVLGPRSRLTVNGTNLSSWCTTIGIEDTKDEVDATGFEETYREYVPGLADAQISCTFIGDTASGGPDETLYPLYRDSTAGTVKFNPDTSGTVVYTLAPAKLYGWPPVSGGPGDLNTIDVVFRNAGTVGLTRGTA